MRKNKTASKWSQADRQAFADRNILKAQTVQGKRFAGATADEWDWDEQDETPQEEICLCWDYCECR